MEGQVKVVMLGNTGVGKTCIINRLVHSKFDSKVEITRNAHMDSLTVRIPGTVRMIRCQIWDTAGQEDYHCLAPIYYKDAKATIVVFDITKMASFEGAKKWIEEVREARGPDVAILLTGNKADMIKEQEVDLQIIKEYADESGIKYCIASAKDNINMKEILDELATLLCEKQIVKVEEAEEFELVDGNDLEDGKRRKTRLSVCAANERPSKCC